MKAMLTTAALCMVTLGMALSCNEQGSADHVSVKTDTSMLVKRGEYLVTIMGCDDCHSPKTFGPHGPEPDPAKRLSGHPSSLPLPPVDVNAQKNGWVLFNGHTTAVAGPWGVSFAANITSDETGIGKWTEAQFFKAIREGKSKGLDGSRMILPPMPWPNVAKATDEDLKAIFYYLKSTKPVKNVVPAPIAPVQLAVQ